MSRTAATAGATTVAAEATATATTIVVTDVATTTDVGTAATAMDVTATRTVVATVAVTAVVATAAATIVPRVDRLRTRWLAATHATHHLLATSKTARAGATTELEVKVGSLDY